MPELPDITVYLEALEHRLLDEPLLGIRIASPFVLRTTSPTPETFIGRRVVRLQRIAKRIVIGFEGDHYAVIHLMIAGRLKWLAAGKAIPKRLGLAAFDFSGGTLLLTEASQKRRASLHLIGSDEDLASLDPGGADPLSLSLDAFTRVLSQQNHTLKRALTDQRYLAGIGNAYSDEILHQARLSPMKQTSRLSDQEWEALYDSTCKILTDWIERLRAETADSFPEKVTAFHEEMAVHGKYKAPCPDCGRPIQRIRYASNECNYCAECQNQGNLLADRSLSRLLKKDWPKRIEDLD